PDQPLATPSPAIRSPTSAVCSEPWPSTTRTPPSPGVPRIDLSSALSWKHLTVVIGPEKFVFPPKEMTWVSQLRTSGPISSTRSAVAGLCGAVMTASFLRLACGSVLPGSAPTLTPRRAGCGRRARRTYRPVTACDRRRGRGAGPRSGPVAQARQRPDHHQRGRRDEYRGAHRRRHRPDGDRGS